MSDDVYAIRTTYPDVAALGQGYLERADGERILLPLPVEAAPGEGVRFIVYLNDGTPAFAGAGRAVQASDQGSEVDPEARFETLIDALVFDERSRPVYDYIVAVRQMAYADAGAAAEAEAEHGEEEVMESDEPSAYTAAATPLHEQPAEALEEAAPAEDVEPVFAAVAQPADEYSDVTPHSESPGAFARAEHEAEPPSELVEPPSDLAEQSSDLAAASGGGEVTARMDPSLQLAAFQPTTTTLPTGTLRRPAITGPWAIAAPRRPAPTEGTGMFLYPPGQLPAPQLPPRPDLDPSQRVQPAAAPPPS